MSRRAWAVVSALATAVLSGSLASAGIIFTDGFGDGSHANNGVDSGVVATDPTDVGIPWYLCGGTSAVNFKVLDDSAGIGNGNALQVNNTGSNNRPVAGQFTAQTLNDGDSLVLRFDMRLVSTSAAADRAFRFGLYNTGASTATGDQSSTSTVYNDDLGYNCRVDVGADTSNSTTMGVSRDDSATSGLIASTTTDLGISSSNTANQLVDANKHHFELTLTRSGTSLVVSLLQDANPAISGTDATPVPGDFTFNEVSFGPRSSAAMDLRFDNIQVEYIPVPEPVGLGLVMLGGAAMLRRRR